MKRTLLPNYEIEYENVPDGYECQPTLLQSLIDDINELINARGGAGAGGSNCCILVARVMC